MLFTCSLQDSVSILVTNIHTKRIQSLGWCLPTSDIYFTISGTRRSLQQWGDAEAPLHLRGLKQDRVLVPSSATPRSVLANGGRELLQEERVMCYHHVAHAPTSEVAASWHVDAVCYKKGDQAHALFRGLGCRLVTF